MKRSKHNLGYYKLFTGDMGQLIPIGLTEVIPGDTIQHATSMLVRMSPMAAPVMHPIQVRVHHFYVPNRIIWPDWEDFITGTRDLTIPTRPIPAGGNTLFDYYGLPLQEGANVNALPIWGFNAIYNEFFRDQDLISERTQNSASVPLVSWEKDYFTTARPWEQKGDAVTLPVGARAPITTDALTDDNVTVYSTDGGEYRNLDAAQSFLKLSGTAAAQGNQLYADLSSAEAININEFRRAFALQRYQEARAQYGSRYTEYLRFLGINPADSRLQRPEYLGGGRAHVNVSEVLQTAPETQGGNQPGDTDYGVGDLYGHGIAALRSNRYRKFFQEHGYVHSFMSVVPKAIYSNGAPRHWWKRDKEDYYQKELVHIGQQPIYNGEVYSQGTTADTETFGYQNRYDEYRRQRSDVAAEYRNLLNYWHLARTFDSPPVLNQSFIECNPSKRIFNEQTQHSLWCMARHRMVARRLIGKRSIGRII